jgi:hypothetical protein
MSTLQFEFKRFGCQVNGFKLFSGVKNVQLVMVSRSSYSLKKNWFYEANIIKLKKKRFGSRGTMFWRRMAFPDR